VLTWAVHSYVQAYDIVRTASGAGNGPTISFHEAFEGLGNWQSFLPGADNVALDNHPYVRSSPLRSGVARS
jgi:glucan 1,3-beta-glucosidase